MVDARAGSSSRRVQALALSVGGVKGRRRQAVRYSQTFLLAASQAPASGWHCGAVVPPDPASGWSRAGESFLHVTRIVPGLPSRRTRRTEVSRGPFVGPGKYLPIICAAVALLVSPPIAHLLTHRRIKVTGAPCNPRAAREAFASPVAAYLDDEKRDNVAPAKVCSQYDFEVQQARTCWIRPGMSFYGTD